MKSNKAARLDDILCVQIKHLGPAALQWLLDMFNECILCTPTASLSYGGNRELSPYSSPAKTQQAQKAIDLWSLCCHTYKLFERLILNRVAPFVDEHLIPEQAGFGAGKSCTSQRLNLTQFLEDGYEEGLIIGAAFVDLSAAYDTVSHRILTRKLFEITQDVRLTELIQNICYQTDVFRGPRWQTQQMAQTEKWPSTRQRPCPSAVQHYIQMTSLSIPTQGVSCTPIICALPHRSNPLRRWNRLLVTPL